MIKKVLFVGLFMVLLVSRSIPACAADATTELQEASYEDMRGLMWSDTQR